METIVSATALLVTTSVLAAHAKLVEASVRRGAVVSGTTQFGVALKVIWVLAVAVAIGAFLGLVPIDSRVTHAITFFAILVGWVAELQTKTLRAALDGQKVREASVAAV